MRSDITKMTTNNAKTNSPEIKKYASELDMLVNEEDELSDDIQQQTSPVKLSVNEVEGLAGILEDEGSEDDLKYTVDDDEIDISELESLEYG